MNISKINLAMLVAVLTLGLNHPDPVLAEDSPVKDAAKQAGHDVKEMGKKAGKAAKDVGKSIGQASKRTYKTIKKEFRKDFIDGKPGNNASATDPGDRR